MTYIFTARSSPRIQRFEHATNRTTPTPHPRHGAARCTLCSSNRTIAQQCFSPDISTEVLRHFMDTT